MHAPHQTDRCPGCGLTLSAGQGPAHPYLGASAACWALFGRLLAREYADPAYLPAHRVTVDAYAAQHPGKPERRTIQSINVHLVGLHLVLERRLHPDYVRRAIVALTRAQSRMQWLDPPPSLGDVTVVDVLPATTPDSHARLVGEWGACVWRAWAPHHGAIHALADWAIAALD